MEVHEASYDMLQAYRDMPLPATKKTPYELMISGQDLDTSHQQMHHRIKMLEVMTKGTKRKSSKTMTSDTGQYN